LGIQEGMRLYISGALHGARNLEAAREKYEAVAELLTREGFLPYLPYQQTDPAWAQDLEPVRVFSCDLHALSECEMVVAFLDEPSLGVGAEIALAIQQAKSVFGVYREGHQISRFIEGLLASSNHCVLLRYDKLEDIVRAIISRLQGDPADLHPNPVGSPGVRL
jgi:hypothetical protein